MLTKSTNGKTRLMRFVSQMLAVLLVIATVITVSPGVGHAAGGGTITSATATVYGDRHTITVEYNVYAFAVNPGTLAGKIMIDRNDDGDVPLLEDNSNNTAIMSLDGTLVITLVDAIQNWNSIQIAANAVKDSNNVCFTQTSYFSGDFNRELIDDEYDLSPTDNKVLELYLNSDTSASNLPNLKDAIQLSTDDVNFNPLVGGDTVALLDNTLTITFATALTGSTNRIKIVKDGLKSTQNDANLVVLSGSSEVSSLITANDLNAPNFVGIDSVNYYDINLHFDKVTHFNVSLQELKNKLSYSTDGEHFYPLNPSGYWVVDERGDSIYLYIDQYQFDFTKAVIKIAGDVFVDDYGHVQHDATIISAIGPTYQSAALSDNGKDAVLTFNENVFSNVGDLKEYISYSENGNYDLRSLGANDTVTVSDNKLTVHFAAGLNGNSIVIYVDNYALKNIKNMPLWDNIVTQTLKVTTDQSAPRVNSSFFSNTNHDLVLVFDEDMYNNTATEDTLKAAISVSSFPNNVDLVDSGWNPVSLTNATINHFGKYLVIQFPTSLTSNKYKVTIQANSVKDVHGNVNATDIVSDPTCLSNTNEPYTQDAYLVHNNQWLNIRFNTSLYAPLVEGISSLHDKITISTDGTNFERLSTDDIVVVNGRLVTVFFKTAKNDNLKFIIEANAIQDLDGNVQTSPIEETVNTKNTPDITGNFYSNAPSEFTFEDNQVWKDNFQNVTIYEETNYSGAYRILNADEYSISAGKLTVNPGVFKHGVYYELYINAGEYYYAYAEGTSILPNETYIMTAPALTRTSGITASVNVKNIYDPLEIYDGFEYDGSNRNATIIFQLMNGTTPVSIVSLDSFLADATYKANFNVADAANPNYTVNVFIVSKYSSDPANVGLNLATIKTQNELDQVQNDYDYENDIG
ncbi:hypothetical protein EHS13_34525 [Paenibacillus psychroresistens]|uniref:Heme-binding protein Shr-like Hb-interacting domain-containing protein n=2 Tax=Paenibacillus psychroresistens TaxID=1778678 RepID=A0A6B8RV18_9BACL|nr:hypothetical protein EHS13_34525 [Paenibacillus psychroresistens]